MMLKRRKIESLPEDIIFNILVRVPAQDICNSAIFVCRTWRGMIRTRVFVHAHLQKSTPGLLFQELDEIFESRNQPIFLATPKGQIETSNFNLEFTRRVLSSCNGLVLEPRDMNLCDLYIKNPSTMQHFGLPSFRSFALTFCAIAYAAADMEYKVVRFFYSHPFKIECAILTVGVDTDWGRRVSTQHLTHVDKFRTLKRTLTTEGFVHWTDALCSDFLSLNVETEVITHFRIPDAAASRHDDGSFSRYYNYLAMGSKLSLLVGLGNGSRLSWEVWEMRPETGEWTQMPNIVLEPHENLVLPSKPKFVTPVGWLNFREVLVFLVYASKWLIMAYNVRTQENVSTELDSDPGTYFLAHKNSLVSLSC